MQDFKHRVALVTGASTGIGEAIAAELFRRGATVVMTGRHAAPLAAAAARLDPDGRRVMTLRMDVRDAPSVQQGIEETVRAAARCICWSTTPGSPARTRWTSIGTRSKTGMR